MEIHSLDLAETPQGAGGVGGLLCQVDSGSNTRHYPAYDLNGNVIAYFDSTGQPAAHFQYDPFGNLTVDWESNAADFPYRFSTKPQDPITGLYYYTYRYYDPVTGRWPSRDPIEELGGINLYGFVGNDGVNRLENLGLFPYFGPGGNPTRGDPGFPLNAPVGGYNHDDGVPTMGDHTAGHSPNKYLHEEQWFESNHGDLIEKQKNFARNDIATKVDCKTRPGRVHGYVSSHDFEDLVLGEVSIETEPTIRINWYGDDWSWTASLTIYDKLGVDYRDNKFEFVITIFGVPVIAPPVPVERAYWIIQGSGCCDES